MKLLGKNFFWRSHGWKSEIRILAPRPPRSTNIGDVESNGITVRQTWKYENPYSDIEYLIDPKPPLDINISKWKDKSIGNLQKKKKKKKNQREYKMFEKN